MEGEVKVQSANDLKFFKIEMISDGTALAGADREAKCKNKILFVLSDGAPLDDSTSSVNPANFLPKHLAAVAMLIEQAKIVELRAVGLDYDNPFYSVTETAQTWNMGVPILEYVFNVSYREAIRREKIKE